MGTSSSKQQAQTLPKTFSPSKPSQLENVPAKIQRRRKFKPLLKKAGFNFSYYNFIKTGSGVLILLGILKFVEYCEESRLYLPNEKLKLNHIESLKQTKAGAKFQEIKDKVDSFLLSTSKKE